MLQALPLSLKKLRRSIETADVSGRKLSDSDYSQLWS